MGRLNKFTGCMIGSALGDAIGEMASSHPSRKNLIESLKQEKKLRYTDDTAMAIGLGTSLLEKGDVNPEHLGHTFCMNYYEEPWRGYGAGPPLIFQMARSGLSYIEAAKSLFQGVGSYGNGACMRIAPLALFFYDSPFLAEKAELSAVVTHAHDLARDGAAILAGAIAFCVKIDNRQPFPCFDFLKVLEKTSRTGKWKEKLSLISELMKRHASLQEAAAALGTSVVSHQSVSFAIYAFLSSPQSFEECLWNAVLNGGDRDSMGAMACAISGAYLGISAIPSPWSRKLENKTMIHDLASDLERWKNMYYA